jgi:hypothetical protein
MVEMGWWQMPESSIQWHDIVHTVMKVNRGRDFITQLIAHELFKQN